jgi:hypothetical protein
MTCPFCERFRWFGRLGMNLDYKGTMKIKSRFIFAITSLAFALASGLSNQVNADDLKEAKVTQVIQDVRVIPSNASARPAAVNDDVRHGTAVQTGVQSRSELTFKDQTITRLGEKTIFSVGEGPRTIDLGSGQFLLCVPKKAGGAKVKAGAVTAAITG